MSKLISEHDYMNEEFDWIGIDLVGCLGFFASGGFGPLPAASLADASKLVNLQSLISNLPRSTQAVCVADVEYYLGDFFEVGERGVYGFNWDFEARSYRLVVKPRAAITISEAGPIAELAKSVTLALRFNETMWIPPHTEVQETDGSDT